MQLLFYDRQWVRTHAQKLLRKMWNLLLSIGVNILHSLLCQMAFPFTSLSLLIKLEATVPVGTAHSYRLPRQSVSGQYPEA